MRRTTTIATLAAICAALAIAPSSAMGKTFNFRGPINQPFLPPPSGKARDVPEVDLKVNFRGKRPTLVLILNDRGIYGPCAPGSPGCSDRGTLTEPGIPRDHPICFPAGGDITRSSTIRNGRFSGTYRSDPDFHDESFLKFTGRVTKKSVTGTIRSYTKFPTIAPGADGNNGQQGYTCDSGVLTYTAGKTNIPSGSGGPEKPIGP